MIKWLRQYVSLSLLVVTAFVAFVLFFNDNSVMKRMTYTSEIRDLKVKIAQYEDTLTLYRELNHRLDVSAGEMEKIVREHYHMQRPDEDVYVFE
jgi:hypothetical protein